MPRASKSSATLPLAAVGENLLGCRDGGIGCGGAHIGHRLGFGLDDLVLGHLGAAGDEIFHPGLGLGGKALGFGLGAGDDRFGLFFSLAAFALEIGQQRLRFFAQPPGFVELGFDAGLTPVDGVENLAMGAEIERAARGSRERRSRPSFRFP